MSTRSLLETIVPQTWDDTGKPGSGTPKVRFLQTVNDLVNRPVLNRVTANTDSTTVSCNGGVQSTGIGTSAVTPQRYSEFTVKARVTFNLSAPGNLYVYVHRTEGNVPANGAAPNAGDVIVGGDAFAGPATGNQNQIGTFSFLDSGLNQTQSYKYYLSVLGTNGLTASLINSSQLLVMERS